MKHEMYQARSRLARLYMYGQQPDPKVELAARQELACAKAALAIRVAIADYGLTPEQRARLAEALRNGGRK